VKISLDKKLLNKINSRSREIQKQQIEESALQPSETLEDSEYITTEPGRNKSCIKIPEFLPSDPEIWFNILDRNLKQNGMTSDCEKFTFAITAIGAKYYHEIRDIILNPAENRFYETKY